MTTETIPATSPRTKARVAGIFYLLTIVAGAWAAFSTNSGLVANAVATLCYVVVTVLFYYIFKPVNRTLSLLAACFSLAGCLIGALKLFGLAPLPIDNLVFFGLYCLLIGYLIFKSAFLPRILGALMAVGGLGWLTFLSPPLAHDLSPFNMAAGILGEAVLTVWLLAVGLNTSQWKQRARAV